MFCGKCGSEIEDGAKFCPSCGMSVEQRESVVVPTENKKGKDKKKSKRGIIVFIVVVLVIVFIGLVGWLMKQKPADNNKPIDTQQTESTERDVTDAEEQEDKPKIKTEEKYYGAKLEYKYEYDTYGNIIYTELEDYGHSTYEYTYSDEKTLSLIYKYYNEDGVLESEGYATCEYSDAGVIRKVTYYDKSGNLLGEQNYNDDGQILSDWSEERNSTYKYDLNGNLIEEIHIYKHNKSCVYYKYDEENNLVEERRPYYYVGTDIVDFEFHYYYAKNGLLTEERYSNEYGEDITTYNRYGDEIKTNEYDEEGNFEGYRESEYQYDEHSNKIECHTTSYDNSYNKEYESWYYWEYTYDEEGNILDQYEYDDDGELIYSYHYTYY